MTMTRRNAIKATAAAAIAATATAAKADDAATITRMIATYRKAEKKFTLMFERENRARDAENEFRAANPLNIPLVRSTGQYINLRELGPKGTRAAIIKRHADLKTAQCKLARQECPEAVALIEDTIAASEAECLRNLDKAEEQERKRPTYAAWLKASEADRKATDAMDEAFRAILAHYPQTVEAARIKAEFLMHEFEVRGDLEQDEMDALIIGLAPPGALPGFAIRPRFDRTGEA